MAIEIGRNRTARQSYGFDDVALIPGRRTVDPQDTEIRLKIGDIELELPILAAAMDGCVDVRLAVEMHKLGALAVLNLQGLQTKYENPEDELEKIRKAPKDEVTEVLQDIYMAPVKLNLIEKRVGEMKDAGIIACASVTPQYAKTYGDIACKAGLDILCLQSTVVSLEHESSRFSSLNLPDFCADCNLPVIIGNTVSYHVALEQIRAGAAAILVGIGPGATCTTRGVLGVGSGQITATADVAAARDEYHKESGKYIPVITDGGIGRGGEVVKAFAAGADGVMIGSPISRAEESPGCGFNWGMAAPHPTLPRGTRVEVGVLGKLEQILLGPATGRDDGALNLVGALREAMGLLGCKTIKELQKVEIVIAPSFMTEGKAFQISQRVGMGR